MKNLGLADFLTMVLVLDAMSVLRKEERFASVFISLHFFVCYFTGSLLPRKFIYIMWGSSILNLRKRYKLRK